MPSTYRQVVTETRRSFVLKSGWSACVLHVNITYYCSVVCALNKDIYMIRCHLPTDKFPPKQVRDLLCALDPQKNTFSNKFLAEGHSTFKKVMYSVLDAMQFGLYSFYDIHYNAYIFSILIYLFFNCKVWSLFLDSCIKSSIIPRQTILLDTSDTLYLSTLCSVYTYLLPVYTR